MSLWEPFTERARRSIVLGQEEAQRLGDNYIGTEHVLLGLVSEGESLAARFLEKRGVTLSKVRQEVEAIVGRGAQTVQQEMMFTPRAKRLVELAFEVTRIWNHQYIGTEHLLAGLVREGEGVAYRVLVNLGVDTSTIESGMKKLVEDYNKPLVEEPEPEYEAERALNEWINEVNHVSHEQLVKAAAALPEGVKSRLEVAIKMFKAAGFEVE